MVGIRKIVQDQNYWMIRTVLINALDDEWERRNEKGRDELEDDMIDFIVSVCGGDSVYDYS